MLFTLVGYKKKQAQKETLSQLQDYLQRDSKPTTGLPGT